MVPAPEEGREIGRVDSVDPVRRAGNGGPGGGGGGGDEEGGGGGLHLAEVSGEREKRCRGASGSCFASRKGNDCDGDDRERHYPRRSSAGLGDARRQRACRVVH